MSVTVSIKVSKELVELADKMMKYGMARSRSHAFNIMIEKGVDQIRKEVEFWDSVYKKAEELERRDYRIKHGGLSRLLEEGRSR